MKIDTESYVVLTLIVIILVYTQQVLLFYSLELLYSLLCFLIVLLYRTAGNQLITRLLA